MTLDRRSFVKVVAAIAAAGPGSKFLQASPALFQSRANRTLKIGHTGLTWITFSRTPESNPFANTEYIEQAAKDIAGLGYWGIEYFAQQIETMEARGGISTVLDPLKLQLISAYCPVNLSDPDKRKSAVGDITRWGKLVKKYGGRVLVIGPNQVDRKTYVFKDNKANIVQALNEMGKAANDVGVTAALHQHTGTCVETRDETYEVLRAMDTRYMKFGPDVGQLQKGGVDPVEVLKEFLPLVHHMHLKDFSGGEHYLGYCPLGEGKMNIPGILDLMEGRKIAGAVMVELDGSTGQPLKAGETATIAKRYLESQGVKFRA